MRAERNPQAEQMAHESMLRTLRAQAAAIWPQERALFGRYTLPDGARIADVGCGSGEICARLAALYPRAEIVGIDVLESWVRHARTAHAALAPRVSFMRGDAFEIDAPARSFDLVVCRHLTQAVPEPELVLAELVRICKPGGWLHVLSEDYGMLHMPNAGADRLWHQGVIVHGASTGTNARIGRSTWPLLERLGLLDLAVDYVVVDTLRVPRKTFAAILLAWRDGFASAIANESSLSLGETRALFDASIASILDSEQYAVWHVPVVSGRRRLACHAELARQRSSS